MGTLRYADIPPGPLREAIDRATGKPPPSQPVPKRTGRATAPNKTEDEYRVTFLDRLPGAVVAFEGRTLALPGGVTYTPDFHVLMPDGSVEYHEVKGLHAWEDGRVKWRVASGLIPGRWFYARRTRPGAWNIEAANNGTGG